MINMTMALAPLSNICLSLKVLLKFYSLSPIRKVQMSKLKDLIELLFMQRQINEKDRHSGQICFPGGKCDGSETDF
jgi:hypothetical protein